MVIHVLSVLERDGRANARARAVADDARISVQVTFTVGPGTSKRELWQRARDEVLRYLDPA